ncbi:MAG TPA: SDR family oxidoreductase [Burkholderiaceae bacterium]|nr:SDR family oxidoreductase [Burkholderiaceae bacterium]
MSTALIIGASRGIGREFVRQLLAAGWKVFATARDAAALAALRTAGAQAIQLDVTLPESMAALGWQLDGEKLDLAVYVAGVYGPAHQLGVPPSAAEFDRVMHTNVLGAMQAMALVGPLVEAARGRFAVLSSGMGSIGEAKSSDAWLYRVSKAALNMALRSAAFDYRHAIFVALDPGWVRTDMGGKLAPTTVEDSVRDLLRVIGGLVLDDSGSYRSHGGRRLAW